MADDNVIPIESRLGRHGQIARSQDGHQIGSGHVQGGKVHAVMARGPLKPDDAKALGAMLRYLGDKAAEDSKRKGNKK